LFIVSYLPVSSFGTGLSYDAGLYHLNNQLWIKSSKIVIGLSNFHVRFGYSSIYDYISSNFWFNENYLFLHFINLTFICTFFLFLAYNTFSPSANLLLKSSSIGILIFGFLDNFGLNGGKNGFLEIEGITKYDSAFGIVFYMVFTLSIFLFYKKTNDSEIILLLTLTIFCIQLRPTGLIVSIPLIIFLIKKNKTINFLKNKIIFTILSIFIFWIIKNLLISGCMFFPIEPTCLNTLDWYQENYATNETNNIRNSLRAYDFQTNFYEWFLYWSDKNEYNNSTILNFIFSFLFVFIYKILFYKSKLSIKYFLYTIYGVFLFIFWITTAPDFRFGIGIFMSLIGIMFINVIDVRKFTNFKFINKFLVPMLFLLTLVFLPRVDSLKILIRDPFINYEINSPKSQNYIKREVGFGVEPKNSKEQCWTNKICTPIYSPPVEINNIGKYKKFKILSN